MQEGSSQVSVPVPKYLAGVSGSGAQGGAVAPMTGTIEKVSLAASEYDQMVNLIVVIQRNLFIFLAVINVSLEVWSTRVIMLNNEF